MKGFPNKRREEKMTVVLSIISIAVLYGMVFFVIILSERWIRFQFIFSIPLRDLMVALWHIFVHGKNMVGARHLILFYQVYIFHESTVKTLMRRPVTQ